MSFFICYSFWTYATLYRRFSDLFSFSLLISQLEVQLTGWNHIIIWVSFLFLFTYQSFNFASGFIYTLCQKNWFTLNFSQRIARDLLEHALWQISLKKTKSVAYPALNCCYYPPHNVWLEILLILSFCWKLIKGRFSLYLWLLHSNSVLKCCFLKARIWENITFLTIELLRASFFLTKSVIRVQY